MIFILKVGDKTSLLLKSLTAFRESIPSLVNKLRSRLSPATILTGMRALVCFQTFIGKERRTKRERQNLLFLLCPGIPSVGIKGSLRLSWVGEQLAVLKYQMNQEQT